MRFSILESIDDVPAADWNRLKGTDAPFLRHEFLAALEHHQCVGPSYGWLPRHLVLHDESDKLVGAVPMYEKDNSYGEFVFDWSWAEAYHRSGLNYYPKLVSAIPYTPATGPRLLTVSDADPDKILHALTKGALELADSGKLSSLHWLFTTKRDTNWLHGQDFMLRLGCQFHWQNRAYADFEDFLARLTAQKRKKIRRERRYVRDAGLTLRVFSGVDASADDWRIMHAFYRSTFDRKSGVPTLSEAFFREISGTMGESVILVMASKDGIPVAGAINLRGADTLYGRHWGCDQDYHSLHFEVCYYQGIDYCIREGLSRFEPGAQGEHKISRGFLPTPTWSAHWIADTQFRAAIKDFLDRETVAMHHYIDELSDHSPYKAETATAAQEP